MSIWEYKSIKNELANANNLVTLNEGNTEVSEFKDNSNNIFLKREDKNPTGSWKDRGTAFKITELINGNKNEAVISSSGNAAISFLTYANFLKNFKMHIVVSPDINPGKKDLIEKLAREQNHKVYYDKFAKRKASQLSADLKIPLLKSSTDSQILKGYWSLGFELASIVKKYRDKETFLLVPVSSGTALVGLIQGLQIKLADEFKMPKVIVCQTQSVHPIIDDSSDETASLADAIVDKSVLRKPQIEKIISETNGEALAITNDELQKAKDYIKEKLDEELSYTSLLSVAAFLRLKDRHQNTNFICITSGR